MYSLILVLAHGPPTLTGRQGMGYAPQAFEVVCKHRVGCRGQLRNPLPVPAVETRGAGESRMCRQRLSSACSKRGGVTTPTACSGPCVSVKMGAAAVRMICMARYGYSVWWETRCAVGASKTTHGQCQSHHTWG